MFVKLTRSGSRRYVQLVESYRDEAGKPRQRTIATVGRLLRRLIDQRLSVVFYDLTTIRAEGLSEQPGELRRFGLAKEGVIARQCLISVVQTAEGLPIAHRVRGGNVAETSTLASAIAEVTRNYPVQRIILVADRGLLSVDNLAMLDALKVADGPLEYIVAVPSRRYAEFVQVLAEVQPLCVAATTEVVGEVPWSPAKAKEPSVKRLVWAHDPLRAAEQSQQRQVRMDALLARAEQCVAKLDAQDAGQAARGRKLSDGGAKARLYHEVIEARLGRIIEVDLKHEQLSWKINEDHLAQARLMDGKLLLVTNVADLAPTEVVQRYKSLADIERGFHVLKSEIEIAPMYHRLPDRIRAHALICFIALVLHRVMRMRLKAAGSKASPERALELLRQLQRHRQAPWSEPLSRSDAQLARLLTEESRILGMPQPQQRGAAGNVHVAPSQWIAPGYPTPDARANGQVVR